MFSSTTNYVVMADQEARRGRCSEEEREYVIHWLLLQISVLIKGHYELHHCALSELAYRPCQAFYRSHMHILLEYYVTSMLLKCLSVGKRTIDESVCFLNYL